MNLVRAISLGGGSELRGNDSTTLICHVQLVILAIDCIFNIIVDNFLRDPLVVLIIFICQVFLLIIALIFYLMASANQAMKQGIHEKLLRHHQLTIILWTIYFSMLIWWYIWTLKRSWPSAGDHFSFSFSGSSDPILTTHHEQTEVTTNSPTVIKFNVTDTIQSTLPQLAAITAITKAGFTTTTTKIPKFNDTITIQQQPTIDIGNMTLVNKNTSLDTIIFSLNTTTISNSMTPSTHGNLTEFVSARGNSSGPLISSSKLISETPSSLNDIILEEQQQNLAEEEEEVSENIPLPAALTLDSPRSNISSRHNVHSDSGTMGKGSGVPGTEKIFFWSSGFIAVYTIERSISLFFYVAYILGTLHIVNAHLMDEGGGDKALHHVGSRTRAKNNNNKTKSSRYDSPIHSPSYIESDSNFDDNGDNFIRQLEDQDGDPFENAQYQYQYKNTYSLYPYSMNPSVPHPHHRGRGHGNRAGHNPPANTHTNFETSDGEEGGRISETEVRASRGEGGGRRNRRARNNARRENFGARTRSAFKTKSPKFQKIGKTKGGLRNMMMMAELGNNNSELKTDGRGGGGIYMTSGDSFPVENPVIVTASVDSVAGSGSTDELLVAELFTRGDNVNYYQTGNDAFDHHESEESDGKGSKGRGTTGQNFVTPRM